jgi:SSS family solute:Na+ symporter
MVIVIVTAIAWSPLIARFPSIFEAINSLLAVLSPPIATVFIVGVFWKRGNKQAGLWTLVFGFILGILTFILDFAPISGKMLVTGEWGIPFMMQAWWLFVICTIFYVVVSLLTPEPEPEKIEGLTLKKPLSFLLDQKITTWYDARVLSLILVAVMVVLYIIFQ